MKKGSRLARRQSRHHARYRGRNDLNIVPMLDVMVILTFFLIFTAVFSKTSIVEVNLPGPEVQAPPTAPTLELEVILRRSGIELADRNVGVLRTIPLTATGYPDTVRLSEHLVEIKNRFPDKVNATLLVADDVDYDTIVQVMDAMRVQQKVEGAKVSSTMLFPQISLGDAPAAAALAADAPAGGAPQ
jgi:biopolymer transport protein ExbD